MKRTEVTYGQLDRALRSLGLSRRLIEGDPPALHYGTSRLGTLITLPPFPDTDRVYDYHLVAVRTTLDLFGIADPTAFAAELRKAG